MCWIAYLLVNTESKNTTDQDSIHFKLSYFHNELFLNIGSIVHIPFIIRMLFSKAPELINGSFGVAVYWILKFT